MSDAYRRQADESGVKRYLRVDEDVQFRSQDGGTHRRSWPQASTDDTDMGRHDAGSIGQLLSAVGDGTGGIPLSVAELIGERDLSRLREYGYVGSQAVTAGMPSSMFEGSGLNVDSPVPSVKWIVNWSVHCRFSCQSMETATWSTRRSLLVSS